MNAPVLSRIASPPGSFARGNGQRHPLPGDRRRRAGEVGSSGHADGHGRRRYRSVFAVPQIRSCRPGVAGSRSFCAVRRSWLDAAVCAVAPDGLRGRDVGRTQGLPAMGIEDAGTSRVWPHPGCRDHHRAARAGHRHRRRHGAGRAADERTLRRRLRRSLHLCDRGRRLPDGGPQPRGDLAGRPSQAQSPDRAVRRQRNLDRRRDVAVMLG